MVFGWLLDWRTGAVLLGSLVAGAVIATVLVSGVNSNNALQARKQTARAASRRIDLLQQRITELQTLASLNGVLLGSANTKIDALAEQVRQMGGRPVVAPPTVPATVPAPRRAPSVARPPTTTTTTTTPQTTTTTMPKRCLPVLCR